MYYITFHSTSHRFPIPLGQCNDIGHAIKKAENSAFALLSCPCPLQNGDIIKVSQGAETVVTMSYHNTVGWQTRTERRCV